MCLYAAPPLPRGLEPAVVVSPSGATADTCQQVTVHIAHRRLNVLTGERASFSGILREGEERAGAGRVLLLEGLVHGEWKKLARTRTKPDGRFTLRYSRNRPGREALRVSFRGDATAVSSTRKAGMLNVYRLAGASWYGGGGSLACGGELTSSTVGVANRTLPCGTLVTLRYDGHTIRVPVVDRGPYVEGREFDLTEATKRALGFGDTGEVWTTS